MEMHLIYVIQIRIWPNIREKKKKNKQQYKNNTCSKYQNQIRKPSESEICMASEYTTILHMIRQM